MNMTCNSKGCCPFCGKHTLEYGVIELNFNMCYFPWRCSSCGHEGEEWYNLAFVGHSIVDENGDIRKIDRKGADSNE